jgi:hypothetical protein
LNITLLASLSLALLLAVIALIHQVRLRRALQALLRRLLAHWRPHANENGNHNPASTSGRDAHDRLRGR